MAKIPSGILGRISGRVGNVVGASWKGIAYIRQYVIPANPDTAGQQAERALFATLVAMAKTLLGSVLQTYWDPFLRSTSGWAHFIGLNRKLYTTPGDYSPIHIAEGILEGSTIATAQYIGSLVTFAWDSTVKGNGSAADPVILYVYDCVNKVGFVEDTDTRTDGLGTVTVGSGRTVADLKGYLFLVDSKTAPTKVSFSDYFQVTV